MTSQLEELLYFQLRAVELDKLFARDKAVIKGRRWRWDFVCDRPDVRLLVEVQGGIWMGSQGRGAHATGTAIQRDCEKLNAATLAGWRQLSFTADMVESGEALRLIERYLQGAGVVDDGAKLQSKRG